MKEKARHPLELGECRAHLREATGSSTPNTRNIRHSEPPQGSQQPCGAAIWVMASRL
jgi:hypothetical protein